ncbi:MAG: hypothetical protein E7668_06775 [Ruminococcaceae bacterium]|nr:hypothetical protein [Oscillospiraceae bacterium]
MKNEIMRFVFCNEVVKKIENQLQKAMKYGILMERCFLQLRVKFANGEVDMKKFFTLVMAVLLCGIGFTSCIRKKSAVDSVSSGDISSEATNASVQQENKDACIHEDLTDKISVLANTVEFDVTCNAPMLVVRDQRGLRLREEGLRHTILYEYDNLGRMERLIDTTFGYTQTWICDNTKHGNTVNAYLDGADADSEKSYYTFFYNEQGKLIKKQFTDIADSGTKFYEYEYDENGNLICVNMNDVKYHFEYEDGLVTVAYLLLKNSDEGSKREFQYDKIRHSVTVSVYDILDNILDNTLVLLDYYYVDTEGYHTMISKSNEQNKLELCLIAKYKDDGRDTRVIGYEDGKIYTSIFLLRDKNGNIYYKEYEQYEKDGSGIKEIYRLDQTSGELVLQRREVIG